MTPNEATDSLLAEFSWNKWFTDVFWPENEYRIRMTMNDAFTHAPPPGRVFDVGCANGFMSYLFSQLGYEVTATDTAHIPERPKLFAKCGVAFFESNFNELEPFPRETAGAFDIALFGEVIEHVLNHPAGLLKSIAKTLRPGGLLLLSTPNPSTLMNALRVARGRQSLWGTPHFINEPKIKAGKIIDLGDVHYREYLVSEVRDMLVAAGFEPTQPRFFSSGAANVQSIWKRGIKSTPVLKGLLHTRMLGGSQYFVAKKKVD